jgi:hypothetical protein
VRRFGVAQRAKLWEKQTFIPTFLVLTQRPFPHALRCAHGDLVFEKLMNYRKAENCCCDETQIGNNIRLEVLVLSTKSPKGGRFIVSARLKSWIIKNLMDGYESVERAFPN